jgi:hypothetical protein
MKKLKLPSRKPAAAPAASEAATIPDIVHASAQPPADAKTEPKAKKTRTKRVKLPKIASAWDIFRSSLRDYRKNWKSYIKILAVVAIPANLIALFNLGSADQLTSSYVSFGSIVMNVAIIWAMVARERTGTVPKISAAYYDGSVALVRFLLVSFSIVIMLLPAAFGAALYIVSLQVADYSGIVGPEQYLIGLVALVLAIPSLYLIVRYATAPLAVVRDDLRPIAALKRARLLSLDRFWPIAGRLVLLGVFLIVLLLPSLLIYFGVFFLNIGNLAQVVFNILTTLTVLPIGNLYMLRLYRLLEHAQQPDAPIESTSY